MILISRKTIGEAHEEIVRVIAERCEGVTRITEDGETTYDPEEPVCIHIDSPMTSPMKSSASLFGDGFSDIYQASLYTITKRKNDGTDAIYTYGNRLCDYPVASISRKNSGQSFIKRALDQMMEVIGYVPASSTAELTYLGDGRLNGIDQIKKSIIDRLIANPSSRRAIAITWVPDIDLAMNHLVCR